MLFSSCPVLCGSDGIHIHRSVYTSTVHSRRPGRTKTRSVAGVTSAHVDGAVGSSPFDSVAKGRGFLPSPDPLRRLALARHDAAAAEWEAALQDIPKLAVASGGSGATAAEPGPPAAGAMASPIKGPLRRALEALPPFPLDKLLLPAGATAGPGSSGRDGCGPAGAGAGIAAAGAEAAVDEAELWRAYLLLSFLAHAYMWCEPGPPPSSLPAVLAVPWVRVAAAVDMPPVLTYATYNLYNWRRLDPTQPPHLGNTVCLQNFLGGPDEEWFRLVHIDIESRAAGAVAGLEAMQQAAAADDSPGVLVGLRRVSGALKDMQATLARMGEQCDPYIYYQRVRTPMSGWRNNPDLPQGLVYAGVSDVPVKLYGETGAQSSVLHAFDAALGVQHDQVWLRDYLDTMVRHMPPPHRAFLADLTSANSGPANVRSFVLSRCGIITTTTTTTQTSASSAPSSATVPTLISPPSASGSAGGGELRDAYNEAVEEMERFRSQHKAFAYTYIAKWASKEATGTGGSNFMPALAGYRDTTSRHLLVQDPGPRA